jgi:spore maturation protein CgeB
MNPSSTEQRGFVLVGNLGAEHVGGHFFAAAQSAGIPVRVCDSTLAYKASPLVRKFNWWIRSHRPSQLQAFSAEVLSACEDLKPQNVLTTGLAPVDVETLEAMGRAGIKRLNFLTDDPWNPAHKATWFFDALLKYDVVYSPREANIEDLRRHGCADVRYLPFAYSPLVHFPGKSGSPEENNRFAADVVFAGGADAERVPYVAALLRAGINVALYGGYWNRYGETKAFDRGFAAPDTLRKAVGGARLALCLVRRANRDGHAMRTWELAAMGACILAEDTAEHRRILGVEGVSALYFGSMAEMVEKARTLLGDDGLRDRMGDAVHARICGSPNTYLDRLNEMLGYSLTADGQSTSAGQGRQA